MKNVWGFYSTTRRIQPRVLDPVLDCSLMQLYALNSWVNSSVWGLSPNCKTVGAHLKISTSLSQQRDLGAKFAWSALLSAPRNSRTCWRRRYRGGIKGMGKYRALISTRARRLRGQLISSDWLASHLKSIYVNRVSARLAGLVHSKTLLSENTWSAINLRFWRASNQNFIRCARWTSEFLTFSSVNVPVIAREESTPLYPFFIPLPSPHFSTGRFLRVLARSYTFITVSDGVSDVFLEKSYAFFAPPCVVGEIKPCAAVNAKEGNATNADLGQAVVDLRELELEYSDEFSDFIGEKPAVLSLDGDVGFRLAPARTPLRLPLRVWLLKLFYRHFWLLRLCAPRNAIPRSIKADWHLSIHAALAASSSKLFTRSRFDSTKLRARSIVHLHKHYNYNNVMRPWALAYWIIGGWLARINQFSVLGQLSGCVKTSVLAAFNSLIFWQSFTSYLITIKVKLWLFFFNFHKIPLLFFYYFRFLRLWWGFVAVRTGLLTGWTSLYNKWFGWWICGCVLTIGFYCALNGVLANAIDVFFVWVLVEALGYCVLAYGFWIFSFLRMRTPFTVLWATLRSPTVARLALNVHKIGYVALIGVFIFCKVIIYSLAKNFAFLQSKRIKFFLNTWRLVRFPKFLQKVVRYIDIRGPLAWPNHLCFTATFTAKGVRVFLKKTAGGSVNLNFLRSFNALSAFWLFFYLVYLNFGSFGWWINSMKGGASSLYLNAVYFAKLFQETPSLGYYTTVSLIQSQLLKLFIYFFELGATLGFTYRSFFSSWAFARQLLPNFLSNLDIMRRYASDTLIEGYLHKTFAPKTPLISPISGNGQKVEALVGVPGSPVPVAGWQYYVSHLLQVGRALAFFLLAVVYRLIRFVWIYLIERLLQAIFLIILVTSVVVGILLQTYGWFLLLKVVVLYFFIICVRALRGAFIHLSKLRK